jgi:septal ring factor EnvC (AmiA/AmiB activator)
MPSRVSREIAEASRVRDGAHTRRPRVKHTDVLVDTARQLERLQAKRRRLRKELREIETNIKHAKRELRALAAQVSGKDDEL